MLAAIKSFLKYFVVGILGVIAAVLIFEYYPHFFSPDFKNLSWKYPPKPNLISYFEIPLRLSQAQYEGQASFAMVDGVAPWENGYYYDHDRYPPNTRFHVKSNVFGFFTKYPITSYPRKKAHEFRIILVGGSGAQGNGGTTNEKMFYSLLEKELNTKLYKKNIMVEVINLASPGQYAATNDLLLHYYGHELNPDMILMYNGANDIAQPTGKTVMMDLCSAYKNDYVGAPYEYPNQFLKNLSQKFPIIFHVHGLGPWIKRTFYKRYYEEKGLHDCFKYAGYSYPFDSKKSFDEISYPSILRSIKSIKRDFCGIPIVFALQAIHDGERALYSKWIRKGIYQELYTDLSRDLKNYYNKDWYFINVDKIANSIYRKKYDPVAKHNSIAVHLDDLGQKIVAGILAKRLYPIILKQVKDHKVYPCGIAKSSIEN